MVEITCWHLPFHSANLKSFLNMICPLVAVTIASIGLIFISNHHIKDIWNIPVQTNTFDRRPLSWYSRPGQARDCSAGHRRHPGQLEPNFSAPGDNWLGNTGGANAGNSQRDFYFLENYQIVEIITVIVQGGTEVGHDTKLSLFKWFIYFGWLLQSENGFKI